MRVFVGTFTLDKELATFTGRPPALSRTYVSTPLPLDVAEEDLIGYEGFVLKDMVDQYGWNRRQTLYPATLLRAIYLSTVLQDEILELISGTTHDNFLSSRVQYVHPVSLKGVQLLTEQSCPSTTRADIRSASTYLSCAAC